MTQILRLNFPQWQGGYDLTYQKYLPDLDKDRAKCLQGYHLGSKILSFIVPKSSNATEASVPVPLDETKENLETINGIYAYNACYNNLQSALSIIRSFNPSKILTIGGECSVSVPSFTFLANKYSPSKTAVVWIDAHPDIGMPGDAYPGYHAMALALCMEMGDEKFVKSLPGKIPVENCVVVGLRQMEKEARERKEKIGLKDISVETYRKENDSVVNWLKSIGCNKVLVHLDLDVLDPSDLFVAVGYEPNGLKLEEVVKIINSINNNFDLVGLTVAERMPVHEMRLRNMMQNLPLFT